jgi:hypothetical protein
MTLNPSFGFMGRPGTVHPHPLQDILTHFTPRTYRQVLQIAEYTYYNHAHIFAAVKKFAEYPVTEVIFEGDDQGLASSYDTLLNKQLKIKRHIINAAIDLFVYGNSLNSIQRPFVRFLVCRDCGMIYNIRSIKYKYESRKVNFKIHCKKCNASKDSIIKDIPLKDSQGINFIRWDPKYITFNHNHIVGKTQYYYEIEPALKYKIEAGDPFTLETSPQVFLKAVSKNLPIRFRDDSIFHMMVHGPAGVTKGIGLPPLISCLKLVYHSAILRRANESLAIERLVPMRVMFPQAASANADPIQMMGMSNFVSILQSNLQRWRWDNNHIMISPFPVGIAQVGENARPMLVDQEIRNTDDTILAALGLPRQFFYGELSSLRGGTMLMRSIENALYNLVSQLDELVQFIANTVGPYMGLNQIDAKLLPFKQVDDVESKQFDMQLYGMGKLSDQAIMEKTDFDFKEERQRRVEEQVEQAKDQMEVQNRITELQQSMVTQSQQQAQMQQGGRSHDPQQMIAEADQIVQQMQMMDSNQQQSYMHTLMQEDYPMHTLVSDRLNAQNRAQTADAKAQINQQQQGAMPPA